MPDPLAHPVRPRRYSEINNFYTATVYEKGSEVVRMIRTILGEDGFRAGLDLYFDRHDGEAATIEQFVKAFEDATGTDLTQFSLWYEQPGTPNLKADSSYDAAEKRFTLTIEQRLKPPIEGAPHLPMHIPVKFGLVSAGSGDMEWTNISGAEVSGDVIHLREKRHTIVFEGIAERPVASLLRGFSAPVTVYPEPDDADLAFLARNDPDEYGRWQALSSLVARQMKQAVAKPEDTRGDVFDDATCAIFTDIAADETYEHAYRALCLTLPGENDIAREIGNDIDPDAIHAVHRAASRQLGKFGERIFARLFHGLEPNGPYSPDAASAGRRSLRNIALSYLCHATSDMTPAAGMFARADNMTDRAHALALLAHLAPLTDETLDALKTFQAEFRSEPIVMDKWFMIQATAPGAKTLDTVKSLTGQPGFSWDNPNRVRSLIGAFSTGNPTGFNRPDGEGYQFLCQAIGRLDGYNPQVAARLLTAMRSWKNLEPGRREKARAAMAALAARPHLSRDVRDILDRTLGLALTRIRHLRQQPVAKQPDLARIAPCLGVDEVPGFPEIANEIEGLYQRSLQKGILVEERRQHCHALPGNCACGFQHLGTHVGRWKRFEIWLGNPGFAKPMPPPRVIRIDNGQLEEIGRLVQSTDRIGKRGAEHRRELAADQGMTAQVLARHVRRDDRDIGVILAELPPPVIGDQPNGQRGIADLKIADVRTEPVGRKGRVA